MDKLLNTVMGYDWGSRTSIARLTGRPSPSPGPEAELWIGAHAAAPSRLVRPDGVRSLDEEIAQAPEDALGPHVRARFGDRLPFLLKILAADSPLSLQAHPSADQALEGHARENAKGVPLGDPTRNYKDTSHKPELLCAITPFEALCGFREARSTWALLDMLGVPALRRATAGVTPDVNPAAIQEVFASIMRMERRAAAAMVEEVVSRCIQLAGEPGRWREQLEWTVRLADRYPSDVGVVGSLLLNYVRLEAGQALAMPAGKLHAYLGERPWRSWRLPTTCCAVV